MDLVSRFYIRPCSGNPDPANIFFNQIVRMDDECRSLIASVGSEFVVKKTLRCRVYQLPNEGRTLNEIPLEMDIPFDLNLDHICSVLRYFGGMGELALHVPLGKKEVKIILGRKMIGGIECILSVEHIVSGCIDEVHLYTEIFKKHKKYRCRFITLDDY